MKKIPVGQKEVEINVLNLKKDKIEKLLILDFYYYLFL